MWRATVLTIFPEMFPGPLAVSLAGKASANGIWSLVAVDIPVVHRREHPHVRATPAGGAPPTPHDGVAVRRATTAGAVGLFAPWSSARGQSVCPRLLG